MDFENSQYYTNRELSWIQFNYRVLEEARDKSNPLFERLKFLSITSSNLDEFFMVRVASLKDMVNAGYKKPDIAGMTPKEQLSAISEALHEFTQTQYSTYNRSLLPLLAKEHITVLTSFEQMNDEEASFADNFFMEKVYPVLTPMAVDASRPFPLIRNKSLNIAALIKTKNQSEEEMEPELEFATVQVPSVMGRIVQLPCTEGVKLILLEEIIRRNISKLFLNYDVISTAAYRIERNADLSIDEEEAEDLLQEIEKQLKQRQWGEAIKLEVSEEIDKYLLKYLKKELAISDEEIYKIQGPLDLTFLMKLYGMEGFDAFKQPKYKPQRCPQIDPELSIFDNIKKGDIFLHHPYITFDPVVNFIKEAAVDPKVLAIKQTLYRVSGNSPIVAALAKAAEQTDGSLLGTFTGEDLVETFAPYFMPDIIKDKQLDTEKLRTVLQELQTIAAHCDMVEKYKKGERASNEWNLPSAMQAVLCQISGFNDAMFDLAIINLVKGDYTSFENAYIPTVEIGVNANTKQADLAKEFAAFVMSREVQDGDFYDGFPVNKESLHMQVSLDRSDYAAYTTIEGADGQEIGLDIEPIKAADADKLEAICDSLSKKTVKDAKVLEELEKAVPAYLLGRQSLDDTISKIQDGVKIYLAE